jgi:tRNA(Leu) C34 or U34 (ribose-2'-O)-methylase TrmL
MYDGDRDGLGYFQGGSREIKSLSPSDVELKGPAVIMMDPKFPHNVGQAVRLCSCYGVKTLVIAGNRVRIDPAEGYRLPREERMRGYRDVSLYQYDRPFDLFARGTQFVAVEVRENAEKLAFFQHPTDAVYVFGPEDGSLGRQTLSQCQRFVVLPTKHCLNLATAIGTVLYDREAKLAQLGMFEDLAVSVEPA